MARRPNVLCSGSCGRLLWHGTGSLSDPTCRECRRKLRLRTCSICGREFDITDRKRDKATYCSIDCRYSLTPEEVQQRRKDRRRANARNRKAVRKNTWDGVPDENIFERDQWSCQMPECVAATRAINSEEAYPSPWSRSVDHVLPLSRGGLDTADNKRIAHLRCNIRRQNKLDEAYGSLRG